MKRLVLPLTASLAWAIPAVAQPKTDPVAADFLFREGKKAAQKGDWEKACPLFADSVKLDPGPGAMMNLADCEEHVGKVASAWEHWREATELLRGKNDQRVGLAKKRVAALEKRLPRLTLKLDSQAPDGTVVERDGVALGVAALDLPVPVDPGEHAVVVRSPGHEDRTYAVEIKEGQALDFTVSVGAALPPPKEEDRPKVAVELPPSGSSAGTTAAVVVLATGGVGLTLGSVMGLIAVSKKNEQAEHCDPTNLCDSVGVEAASAGQTASTISTIAFAAGGAAIAAGIVLLVLNKDDGKPKTATLAPTMQPSGGGLVLRGAF